MPDPTLRLLLEGQGFGASAEAHHDEVMMWMASGLNGHPRAQDFEPTGHGGSDPTAVNGQRPDRAAADGKAYVSAAKRYWAAGRELDDISRRWRTAIRPSPGPVDEEFCFMHYKYEKTALVYRIRLCRPCYDRRGDLAKQGLELTDEEVRYHATWGKWPKGQRVDPKAHRQPTQMD